MNQAVDENPSVGSTPTSPAYCTVVELATHLALNQKIPGSRPGGTTKIKKVKKIILSIKPEILMNEDGIYTIFDSNNKGGAIMSDLDPSKAMEKFKEATHLACAVRTLMEFKGHSGKNFYIPEFI